MIIMGVVEQLKKKLQSCKDHVFSSKNVSSATTENKDAHCPGYRWDRDNFGSWQEGHGQDPEVM